MYFALFPLSTTLLTTTRLHYLQQSHSPISTTPPVMVLRNGGDGSNNYERVDITAEQKLERKEQGCLFQQYDMDQCIKLETTRLDYFRTHQDEMGGELYQGISDSVVVGETGATKVGKRIVLPSSFLGGARDMKPRYLDSMALVQKFNKCYLFID